MYTEVHRTSEEKTIKYTLFQRSDKELACAISFAAPVVHSLPKEKGIVKDVRRVLFSFRFVEHFSFISLILSADK